MEVFKNIFDNLGITEFARPSLGISDILDILIVAYIIYKIIFWIKETRAWVLFKGILVIFALAAVAMLLNDSLDSFQHHFRRHHCGYRCIPAGAAKGTGADGQRKILHRLRQKL